MVKIGRSGRTWSRFVSDFDKIGHGGRKFLTDNTMKLMEKMTRSRFVNDFVNTNTKVRLCRTIEIGRSGCTRSRFVNTNTKVRLCQTVEIGRSGRTRSRFVNHVILVHDFVNTSKTSAKTNTKVRLCRTIEIGRIGRTWSRFVNTNTKVRFVNDVILVNDFDKIGRSGVIDEIVIKFKFKSIENKSLVLSWVYFTEIYK